MLTQQPDTLIREWGQSLARFVAETDEATRHVCAALVEENAGPLTRERLAAVADALPKHRDAVTRLFAEVGIEPHQPSSRGEPDSSILSYYTLVHRDWAWPPEVDEVAPSVQAIVELLPGEVHLGTTLILGAGTARLAWELGNRLSAPSTLLAVDVNPLPFLVTQKLMRGESVRLYELPAHPRRASFAAVEHCITAANAPPEGLVLLFGDGLDPPVARGCFDTVITPWFVDQVPEDAASIVLLVHDLLKEGGSWINHGPFVYDPSHTAPAHRYAADEYLHLVARGGFRVTHARYQAGPHFASPYSSQGRTETVLTFHATKKITAPAQPSTEPNWLRAETRARTAIPRLDGLEHFEAPHPTVAKVLALIDGKRTARDICRILVDAGDIAPDGNEQTAVYACLKVLYQASLG